MGIEYQVNDSEEDEEELTVSEMDRLVAGDMEAGLGDEEDSALNQLNET